MDQKADRVPIVIGHPQQERNHACLKKDVVVLNFQYRAKGLVGINGLLTEHIPGSFSAAERHGDAIPHHVKARMRIRNGI